MASLTCLRRALAAATLVVLAAAQTWSPTATPTSTPLPCPLRLFSNRDVVGDVLSRTMQPSEASCMANCCGVNACVGYSFSFGLLTAGVTAASGTVGVRTDYVIDRNGNACASGTFNWPAGSFDGSCATFEHVWLHSSGDLTALPQQLSTAPCVLLTNVTHLVPSNLARGGIKLSALGS